MVAKRVGNLSLYYGAAWSGILLPRPLANRSWFVLGLGMAANYGRPKPIDPLWYRRGYSIRASCECGRIGLLPIAGLLETGYPPTTYLYEIVGRLRCQECGGEPRSVDVVR